jgi:glycerol uptake facilitator-like aquaporin
VNVGRQAAGEFVGTALLLAAVVGSGIMGERLSGGNAAIALLANALATGFALVALIVAFGPRTGAHFNPVVTAAFAIRKEFPGRAVPAYVAAQIGGAIAGVLIAHAMFDLELLQWSAKGRSSVGQWLSEVVATAGLVFVVLSCDRSRPWAAPAAVGGYIAAAYWFTASTSFANPAVTLARGLTTTFSGINPGHIAPFVMAQLVGAGLGLALDRFLTAPPSAQTSKRHS